MYRNPYRHALDTHSKARTETIPTVRGACLTHVCTHVCTCLGFRFIVDPSQGSAAGFRTMLRLAKCRLECADTGVQQRTITAAECLGTEIAREQCIRAAELLLEELLVPRRQVFTAVLTTPVEPSRTCQHRSGHDAGRGSPTAVLLFAICQSPVTTLKKVVAVFADRDPNVGGGSLQERVVYCLLHPFSRWSLAVRAACCAKGDCDLL